MSPLEVDFERSDPMLTHNALAELSRALDDHMVLSVYLARENQDPGKGPAWLKRLEVALGDLRSDLEGRAPTELPAFDKAVDRVMSSVDSFGRILPHEGWVAVATDEKLWLAEGLPYRPREVVRWRPGLTSAPYVRALKARRPAVLAVISSLHTDVYRYDGDGLSEPERLQAEWPPAEAADVGVSKRASRASGTRGVTRADYVKRAQDENLRKHRKELEETLQKVAGADGIIVLGGTQKAISAVHKDLEEVFPGRLAEAPEIAFDSSRDELVEHLRAAASALTEARQSGFLDLCQDPHRGSTGWNETYRALAAGAVDRMLVSRDMLESSPDDAERLVRLALAQGAEVEEVGGAVGERLMKETGGVAARLRFVPASLQA